VNRSAFLMASLGMLLAGCASGPRVDQPDPAQHRISIGWIRHDWRTCEEEGDCPRPTPKTVVLASPISFPEKPQFPAEPRSPVAVDRQPVVVHFEFAAATPTKAGAAELEEALTQIRQGDTLRIIGHTDDIGGAAFNDRLARRRAEYAAAWLRRHDVKNPMRIEAHGKCCYVAPNDSDKGRAANRRVEIHFATTHKENVR